MRGQCLCGDVTFKVTGPLRDVIACHCGQCRKTSGHFVAATQVSLDHLSITGAENITWFTSSDTAERGFCARCGSQLFWKPTGKGVVSIFAGALDGETGLKIAEHIFVEDKGDYYDIP